MKDYFVIGVDGGATKSTAALADSSGRIWRQKRGRNLNYHSVGAAVSREHLRSLLSGFLKRYDVKAVVIGFAGLDTKHDRAVFEKIAKGVIPRKKKFLLCDDAKISLEAACTTRARLLIISGTGSNVYGEYGQRGRGAGGWDFLLADEGSAFGFGIAALRAAVRSFDGRGPKTRLERLVVKSGGVKDMPELITRVYQIWNRRPHEFKKFIASFAPAVDRAYRKGDRIARAIIMEGVDELYLAAREVIVKLKMERQPLCVGYVGSNFKAPRLKSLLSRKIRTLAPKAFFNHRINPVEGAVKMALDIARKSYPSTSSG